MNETNITESETIRDESKCMKMDLSDRFGVVGRNEDLVRWFIWFIH